MTARLFLVRHAPTAQTRRAAFPSATGAAPDDPGESLDAAGIRAAAALADHLPGEAVCRSSHARRCLETAFAVGREPEACAALAECDFGAWAGRTPAEVDDHAGLLQWYADPDTAPHGGERLVDVRRRARSVLDDAASDGATIAFTSGGFIKAAVLEILGLPSTAVWQLDAAPASITELHADGGRWRVVRLNWTPGVAAAIAGVA